MLALLLACTAPSTDSGDSAFVPHPGGRIELLPEDGSILVGEFYPASAAGRASVLIYNDQYHPVSEVPASFIEELRDRGWNVLAMDDRISGLSTSPETGSDWIDPLWDVQLAIEFIIDNGGAAPALLPGDANCGNGMLHAYKVETLQDRTAIPAYAMLPYNLYSCGQLQPYQLPDVPTLWLAGEWPLDDYAAEDRDNWVFPGGRGWMGWINGEREDHDGPVTLSLILDFLDEYNVPE